VLAACFVLAKHHLVELLSAGPAVAK